MSAGRSGPAVLFRTDAGRLRLGWRLGLFGVIAAVVALVVGLLLPVSLTGSSVATLAGALVAGWLLLAKDGRDPGALGFYLDSASGRELLAGLAFGVGLGLVVVGIVAAAGGLSWSTEAGTLRAWVAQGASALAFLALPAAAEEALLRGYPLQAIAEAWGARWALLVTSGVFGVLHLGNPEVTTLGAMNVVAAGVLLGVVYLRTGSLWWASGVHLGWNWAHAYVADLPVSGFELFDAPFYDGVARGPAWLGGGGFGPEGSVVATLVVAAAAALCWRGRWLRPTAGARVHAPLALVEIG